MRKIITTLCIIVIAIPAVVFAQSLTSTNYTIMSSDFHPGMYSTSSNYSLSDVLGDFGGRTATSTNYSSLGGYIGTLTGAGTLSATLSASSLSLGELATESVTSDDITITVTTDSPSGYNVQMSEDTELTDGSNTIDDVSDGEVTAGSEEYGIRTSGAAGQFNATDTSITSDLKTVASSAIAVSSQETTVTFKAAISTQSEEGSYSHTVSFATVANF